MPAEWAFFGGTRCAYSPSYTLEALWIIIRLLRLFAFRVMLRGRQRLRVNNTHQLTGTVHMCVNVP